MAVGLFAALPLAMPSPADAIPSPELVVGALSGLGQLGALLMGLLGGGAALALGRGGSAANAAQLKRWRRATAAIACLAAGLAGVSLQVWSSAASERQARLEATLSRPSRLPGQPNLDPTLKELNFAEQSRHPLGLTTAEAERLIADPEPGATPPLIVDIRERAEVEMGTFTRATAIRFPDLDAQSLARSGRRVLLICHNGNRSSETCQALAANGVDCRFIAGGLEKWIVEGRTAGGFHRRSLSDVRALPEFPNNRRLLETAEVQAAVATDNAVFVDVRYPGEFKAGHLPGAVNIGLRAMPSHEVARAIAALPQRPVIVPCYDRRSCFFGEVLGLELTRAGRTFLGRYTVPWDYALPTPPPPHIAAALAEAQRGWWDRAADWLAMRLAELATIWGLPLVLLALAGLSRLLILPLSLKAERDQMTARRIEGEVADLKSRHGDDPPRLARAMQALYRRHGLTPLRNQLALLLFPVLALSVTAAGRAAERSPSAFLWLVDLSRPDPLHMLPLAFAVLFTLYIHWTVARTPLQRLVTWALGVPGFALLGLALPAASALYLVVSALLLILQRLLVTGLPRRILLALKRQRRRWQHRRLPVPTLIEARTLSGVGNKARRLGVLAADGVPVPPGVVLDRGFLRHWNATRPAQRRRLARSIARTVGGRRFAVRSSAVAEDGAEQSFAGVYESVLDVRPAELVVAIDRVLGAFAGARAQSYARSHSDAASVADNANIIVQRMVEATYAGVLFTRAPDAAGQMLVELVAGSGEALVSGFATPRQFRLGRISATLSDGEAAPIDLAPLARLGQHAETLFGHPQDIEWTWRRGQFIIVQSRDITMTSDAMAPAVDQHWCEVLGTLARSGASARLVRNELAEMLPRPTPLSLSLMEQLYAAGGSVDLACRALGLTYRVEEAGAPAFIAVLGRLYANAGEASRRAPRLSKLDLRRLRREADAVEAAFHGTFVPRFLDEMAVLRATDFESIETAALLRFARALVDRFITTTHVEAEIVNILAELAVADARRLLASSGRAVSDTLRGGGASIVEQALRRGAELSAGDRDTHLLHHLGHRATLDYELASPRYHEDPAALRVLAESGTVHRAPPKPAPPLPRPLADAVTRAARLQTLKEDAKHIVLMELAQIRRILLAIDRRFDFGGHIFQLPLSEALTLETTNRRDLWHRAQQAAALANQLADCAPLPPMLTLHEIENVTRVGAATAPTTSGALVGTRVAGRRVIEGRALVVAPRIAEAGLPPPGFVDGDIIVTSLLHPAWLPQVLRAGGVVSATGGWLSHMAIVARERDVAMIVGVDATTRLVTGAQIRLHLDGRIEIAEAVAAAPAAAAE